MTAPNGPPARFLDLWLDAHDVAAVAQFWAKALGLTPQPPLNGAVRLVGDHAWDRLWVRPAPPEARHCAIHVDVTIEHITQFLELGATVLDASSYPWVVLAGPEGCEICAFPGEGTPARRILDLVMDTTDPAQAAAWWAGLLDTGYHASGDGDYAWVAPVPGALFESIVYARQDDAVRDARRLRPRVATHDLGALFDRGAARAEHAEHGRRTGETMLLDPCGNEFFVQVTDLVIRPDDE